MAGFNFFGVPPAIDPNSLPALLHRPPGLIPGPIQAPQLGQSPGFRPPPLMNAPQMSMPGMSMPQQQTPGFGIQDGAAMLGAGLAGWKPGVSAVGPQGSGPGGAYTPGDAAGMAAGAGLDLNGGMTLSPMDPSFGDLGMAPRASGPFSFLGSIPDFLSRWSPGGGSNA
jgi:hypothetical protein